MWRGVAEKGCYVQVPLAWFELLLLVERTNS